MCENKPKKVHLRNRGNLKMTVLGRVVGVRERTVNFMCQFDWVTGAPRYLVKIILDVSGCF